jgi:predicted RNA-binding Zn ribbon-like protein
MQRLGVAIADALAHTLEVGGLERLGACAGSPCHCVYIDRTRAGRQRYCCELCNDRMAAAAYRRRNA